MNGQEMIPRSRGSVCGVLLILLGLWGGLAPFVGPYFHFGYTPDTAWHYDLGRLVYSAIPGAAALVGGVVITITRNRAIGITGGVLAALGGAWFVFGAGFVTYVLKLTINAGGPIFTAAGNTTGLRFYLETVALFSGVGVVIVLLGAIAMGRFSMVAATDIADVADGYQTTFPATSAASQPDLSQYPSSVSQYPSSITDPVTATSPTAGAPPFAPAPFPDTTTGSLPPAE